MYDRHLILESLCKNKNVLHIGAARALDLDSGIFDDKSCPCEAWLLHARLRKIASNIIGIDINKDQIKMLAQSYGITDIIHADAALLKRSDINFIPDVIVVGEVIEHLGNPENTIKNLIDQFIQNSSQSIVVTTPNLYSALSVLQIIAGRDDHDITHVHGYTRKLLSQLFQRLGLENQQIFSYQSTAVGANLYEYPITRSWLKNTFIKIFLSIALKINTNLCDGIVLKATYL